MTAVNPYSARPYNEEAVGDAVAGCRVDLTPADRTEAVRRMARHMDAVEIAARLGISRRTVNRAKARTS